MHPINLVSRSTAPFRSEAEAESSVVSSASSDSIISSSSEEGELRPSPTYLPSSAASVTPMPAPAGAPATLQPLPADLADARPSNPVTLKTVLPFKDVPPKAAKIQRTLLEVERNIILSHEQLQKAVSADRQKAQAHALLKRLQKPESSAGDPAEADDAYDQLRLGRKANSACEIFLEKSELFGPLLFAPTGGIRDTRTGLYAELRKLPGTTDDIEYVLCFPGTGCGGATDSQWKANVSQATSIGGVPALYRQAQSLASELKEILVQSGARLSVAGHSMGGAVANFVGLALELDSWCFNSAALGHASLSYLEVEGCLTAQRIGRQVHIGFSDDWVTHPTLMAGARALAKLAGHSTARPAAQVGQVYHLAPGSPHYPAKLNLFERHLLQSLGGPLYQHTRSTATAGSATTATTATAATTTSAAAPPSARESGTDSEV